MRLSGHRGAHLFAHDHRSLTSWLAAVPDAISSHHIVHSAYSERQGGEGQLSMVVAYQAPGDDGMHGSIISYETRIEFAPDAARFTMLDKAPILSNTRARFETSWATNRVLALVHAQFGGITGADDRLRAVLGPDVEQLVVQTNGSEGSRRYDAIITGVESRPVGAGAPRHRPGCHTTTWHRPSVGNGRQKCRKPAE